MHRNAIAAGLLGIVLVSGIVGFLAWKRSTAVSEVVVPPPPPPSTELSDAPDPTPKPGPVPVFAEGPGFRGTVLQATDAGTLLIRPEGQRKPVVVRLIGLTPPVKASRDKDGQEPWATRGQQALAVLLVRKDVRVEFDILRSEMGQNGLWGYVWLPRPSGDLLVNEVILAEGHAILETRVPNVKYVDRLREAQKSARESGKNIWNAEEPLPESPAEYLKNAALPKPLTGVLEKWETGCIVGNKKTKKYHIPTGQYYTAAKNSPNAIFFATETDAKSAGYEAAAR